MRAVSNESAAAEYTPASRILSLAAPRDLRSGEELEGSDQGRTGSLDRQEWRTEEEQGTARGGGRRSCIRGEGEREERRTEREKEASGHGWKIGRAHV